jgi:hypothetical protein
MESKGKKNLFGNQAISRHGEIQSSLILIVLVLDMTDEWASIILSNERLVRSYRREIVIREQCIELDFTAFDIIPRLSVLDWTCD